MAFREVVENRDRVAGIEQFFRANGTNVARTASDKNIHADSLGKFHADESSKEKKPIIPKKQRRRDEPYQIFLH
jgi:hypothetical protein